jgi:hypothetical protein
MSKPQPTAEWIALVTAANDFLGFDTGGMLDFERPKYSIQNVAAHVSQRTISEIVPAVPLVRDADLCENRDTELGQSMRPNSILPARQYGRTRANTAISAISPAMGFSDVTHYTTRNETRITGGSHPHNVPGYPSG